MFIDRVPDIRRWLVHSASFFKTTSSKTFPRLKSIQLRCALTPPPCQAAVFRSRKAVVAKSDSFCCLHFLSQGVSIKHISELLSFLCCNQCQVYPSLARGAAGRQTHRARQPECWWFLLTNTLQFTRVKCSLPWWLSQDSDNKSQPMAYMSVCLNLR